ncbi:MAG: sulfatase-like hydrolase/transferase [Planctomycetota bacterium]
MAPLDEPPPANEPPLAVEVLRDRLAPIVAAAAFVGFVDGVVRLLGVDPGLFLLQLDRFGLVGTLELGLPSAGEVLRRLLAVAQASFHYALIGAVIGLVAGGLASVARRALGRPWAGSTVVRRTAAARAVGLWAAVAIYWWTRPVVYPGLSATDPRRLVAAAVILVVGVLVGAVALRLTRPFARRVGVVSAVLAAAGGLVTVFAIGAGAERGRIGERNADMPNVLLVIVDALRQDTLSAYGDEEVHTPHIDRLAEEGVLFESAFAQAPFTWPSFGSFLTGKVPRRHGLLRMEPGVQFPVNATLPVLLKSGVRADGVELEERDWITGAFMTGTLSHGSRLLVGFDAYLEALVGHDLVDVHDPWSEFRSGLLPWLVLNKLSQKSDRHLVTTTAERWIRQHSDRRFMALVHLYSTHTPYDPAPEFRARHLDPAYDGPFDSFVASHREAIEDGEYEPTEADVRRIRRLYLAGVEQADAMIGRLVATLSEEGILDDTIVIVSSDHGESLGEHGLWEHNWMYQDNLRIPLVMRFPSGLGSGARVGSIVDSIDVLPTVLDLTGIEAPESASVVEDALVARDGAIDPRSRRLWSAIDGTSLVPLARGEADAVREHTFSENGLFLSVQDARWKLIVRRELVRPGAWGAFLATPEGLEPPRLFDLESDPAELRNLFDPEDPEALATAERLFAALAAQLERLPIRDDQIQSGGRDLRAEAIFQSLGYGGGVGESDDDRDGQ